MKKLNLQDVSEATDYKRVPAGGYICVITSVEDFPEREYLRIEYDIAEGEFNGYYQELFNRKDFWGASFIKSYKDKALPFFKAFITAVKNSNTGYVFNNDETTLLKKRVGLVLGEEEYIKNDGTEGVRLYVDKPRSIEEIRKGVEVPEIKRLKTSTENHSDFGHEIIPEEEIPF